MAAKIPQDVTREDRLVGPLTLRQFLYLLGGGALVFLAYQYYASQYLFLIEFVVIAFVATTLSLALAFAKINGRDFAQFVSHLWGFIFSPKLRTWQKDPADKMVIHDNAVVVAAASTTPAKSLATSQLEVLANVLDTGGKINEATAATHKVGSVGEDIAPVSEPSVEDVLSEVDKI